MKFLNFVFLIVVYLTFTEAVKTFSDDPYELQQIVNSQDIPTISPKDFDPDPVKVEEKKINPEDVEPDVDEENMQDVIEDLTDNTRFLAPLTVQEKNMMSTRTKRRQEFRQSLDQNVEDTLKSIKEDTDNEEAKRQEKLFERNLRNGNNPMSGLSTSNQASQEPSSARNHFDDDYKFMQMP